MLTTLIDVFARDCKFKGLLWHVAGFYIDCNAMHDTASHVGALAAQRHA